MCTTQDRSSGAKPRSVRIEGSATFITAMSRATMNWATATAVKAAPGRPRLFLYTYKN